MAERVRDGGGTTTEQVEQAEREESRPAEPERDRPTRPSIVVPIAIAISTAVQVDPVIPAMAAIFGAILCVVGVAVMAKVVGLA